mgnify:CR=1 FL=1
MPGSLPGPGELIKNGSVNIVAVKVIGFLRRLKLNLCSGDKCNYFIERLCIHFGERRLSDCCANNSSDCNRGSLFKVCLNLAAYCAISTIRDNFNNSIWS